MGAPELVIFVGVLGLIAVVGTAAWLTPACGDHCGHLRCERDRRHALSAEDAATLAWAQELHHEPRPFIGSMSLGDELALHELPGPSGLGTPGKKVLAGSEPQLVTGRPAPPEAPTKGDAQERDGGCAPPESRPAAGADLTGLLSPHHEEDPGWLAHGHPGPPGPLPIRPDRSMPGDDRWPWLAADPWADQTGSFAAICAEVAG